MSVFDGVKALQKQVNEQGRARVRGWHGHSVRGNRSGAYQSWLDMRRRCLNPACKDWPNYGGRGIKICYRWSEFLHFYEDMGDRPEGMSLDRIDVNKNYGRANCRWASKSEQQRNRRCS